MKRLLMVSTAALLCLGAAASHKGIPTSSLSPEVGGRFSVEIEKKIMKGWHVYLSEQVRFDENFTDFERLHTTLGTEYSFNKHLKGSLEYSFINNYKSGSSSFNNRHRLSVALTEGFKAGDWAFDVKETFRFTHKAYDNNVFQSPRNPLTAKVKFLAKYKGLQSWTPYAGVEGRVFLNGAACSATYNSSSDSWSNYSFTDYSDMYLNRVRGIVGAKWKLSKSSSIDFKLLLDYCMDNVIDTNSDGTKLKSMVVEKQFFPQLSVGYKFSF